MKLYSYFGAPNPKMVRIYLAEKGIQIPTEEIDIVTGGNRTPEFLKKNPLGLVPVLELDDGSYLTESLAIVEYLEELHPSPTMFGTTPVERARTRELERLAEIGVQLRVATIFMNTHPFMAARTKQSPEAAETARGLLAKALKVLDDRIGNAPFVAGARPTIADCRLCAAFQIAEFAQVEMDPSCTNVHRWYEGFKQRPSAQA